MIRFTLVIISYIVSMFLFNNISYAVNAESKNTTKQSKSSDAIHANVKVQQQSQSQLKQSENTIINDAIIAVHETHNALIALDKDKKKDALNSLEKAAGKLQLILARNPDLSLAPTKVDFMTISMLGDADKINEMRKKAITLLESGDVQGARHILEGLASETVISVKSIPLATYPETIKKAVKLIDEGKQKEAMNILQIALNTLNVNNTIIPLPVLMSQELLKSAEKLAEKKERTEDENKHLTNLLGDARRQLKRAELLGYGNKNDFIKLYDQLDVIENKTNNGKLSSGLFSKIQEYLKDAVRSSQPNQSQNRVAVS